MIMKRSEEVRRILSLSVEELVREAAGQLKVLETLDEVYEFLAEEMVREFRKAAEGDRIVSFIMPVGPTQPYRIMAEKINYLNLNLKNVRFFFMDEYCDDNDQLIPTTHPLSFRGQIGPLLFNRIRPDLLMPREQIIFPSPENLRDLPPTANNRSCAGTKQWHRHRLPASPCAALRPTGLLPR